MDEMTLEDVERDWPGWRCWRGGVSGGLVFARDARGAVARGEDPRDLADEIRRQEARKCQW